MAWRKWFTPQNTQSRTIGDLAVLNRAARQLVSGAPDAPSASDLTTLNMLYTPGMSANDLIKAFDEEIAK